jgi:hypothetical protein
VWRRPPRPHTEATTSVSRAIRGQGPPPPIQPEPISESTRPGTPATRQSHPVIIWAPLAVAVVVVSVLAPAAPAAAMNDVDWRAPISRHAGALTRSRFWQISVTARQGSQETFYADPHGAWLESPVGPVPEHNRCRLDWTPRVQRPCCPRKHRQQRKLPCVSSAALVFVSFHARVPGLRSCVAGAFWRWPCQTPAMAAEVPHRADLGRDTQPAAGNSSSVCFPPVLTRVLAISSWLV